MNPKLTAKKENDGEGEGEYERGEREWEAVEMHDERFTTRIAQRIPGTPGSSEDSRAAAHLLEGWLSSRAR